MLSWIGLVPPSASHAAFLPLLQSVSHTIVPTVWISSVTSAKVKINLNVASMLHLQNATFRFAAF